MRHESFSQIISYIYIKYVHKHISRAKANSILGREQMVIVNTLFQEHKRRLHMDIIRWKILKSGWLYSLQSKMWKLYTVSKNKTGSCSESESRSLCDPMYYTVHGILQAKILEWIFPFPGDLPNPWIEPKFPALQMDPLPAVPQGQHGNTGVGSLSLLQESFLTQESKWSLLNCRQIL